MGSKWRKGKVVLGLNLCAHAPRTRLDNEDDLDSLSSSAAALLSPPTPASNAFKLSKSLSRSSKELVLPSHSIRTASYSYEEDKLLCSIFMDIAQDAQKGNDRSTPELWKLIAQEYKQMLPAHIGTDRPWRSLQTRWANILTAVNKLRGCIQQIENMNPSGASEQDILGRAKELLMQESKYKKGFKFDHVWHIVKDMQKFCKTRNSQNVVGRKRTTEGSQSQSLETEESIGSCSFAIDLNDDFETDDHCNEMNNVDERPTGKKKEKMKKQLSDERNQFITAMEQQTAQFKGMFEHNHKLLQKQYELDLFKAQTAANKVALAKEKVALAKRKEENKILRMNLNLIEDPTVRESIRRQQLQIAAERNQEHGGRVESNREFDKYFDNLGGSGSGLGNY